MKDERGKMPDRLRPSGYSACAGPVNGTFLFSLASFHFPLSFFSLFTKDFAFGGR